MILLISSSEQAPEIARVIQSSTGEKIEVAGDVRRAIEQLRRREFTAVIIDESLMDLADGKLELLLKRIEPAMPVFVNLGISRSDRAVRDVLTALRRAEQEREAALTVVQTELRGQLRSELTAILLTSQQLLSADLPHPLEGKVRSMLEVAQRMRTRLDLS
jgi:DNA-binding NtrC family response regulator